MNMWFEGPAFLRTEPNQWPTCEDLGPTDTLEFKRHVLHIDVKAKNNSLTNF